MNNKGIIAMMIAASIMSGCSQKEESKGTPAIDKENMGLNVNPGEDFFRFANQGWLDKHPIPDEYTTYGAFTELSEINEVQLQDIIKTASENQDAQQGSVAQKIRDFYNAGMDTVAIEEKGFSELMPYLDAINAIQEKSQLASMIGHLHFYGYGSFFSAGVGSDPQRADMNIMHVFQGGLGLPDRDDYLDTTGEKAEMHSTYKAHISKMFQIIGDEALEADQKADAIFALETRLAGISLSRVERRDPDRTNNPMTYGDLKALCPILTWDDYFSALGAPAFDSLNVGMPEYMIGLDKAIAETDLQTLKDYMSWKFISGSASALCSSLDVEHFNFYGKYLYGQEVQQPRWRRVLNATSDCLGEAIGQLYVEKYFPAESKEKMVALVGNLKTALGERIKVLDWMSDGTKELALSKLEKINVKVGYPDKWKDYSEFQVAPDSYFQNLLNSSAFETRDEMSKLGKPVDKDEWFMTPQTVNAYYSPDMNEIVFPAGILQPPFFNAQADDAVNYGGIGVVIGHEMTHGFDDQGRKYDEKGNLNDWWTEEDATRFNERTQQLVKLFNEFELRGNHINGELTLGENIADLGGLNIAWDAYQMTEEAQRNESIDGFTPAQRFFISYGTVWRNQIRDKALERRIKEDVHSPAEARVNRALGSMPHFYEAFECNEGDKMYIAPEERAKIW